MSKQILIITDDPTDANILIDLLGHATDSSFATKWVTTLFEGLEQLRTGNIDAVIASLSLPESSGIGTFDQLFTVAPYTPILTLNAIDDELLAMEAVQHGAQGYLFKGHLDSHLVSQTLCNVILRKAVEEELYQEKARAEIALKSISDAVICTDLSGKVNYLNIAAEVLTGWTQRDANGQAINEVFQIVNGVTRERDQNPVELVLQTDKQVELNADTVLIRRDGSETPIEDSASPIHDWSGKLTGAVIVFHDVSSAQAMTMKMAHLAQHDFLTDLPNRVLLNDRIAQAIALANRHNKQLALLFLDLDNFKHINDSLGHVIGDKLLQSVAQRLITCVRDSDTVSRMGGDEFVILLTETKDQSDAGLTAEKIVRMIALPHFVAMHELYVTTSIGISVFPSDSKDTEGLIRNADTAMYHAKGKGRNNYRFFRNGMNVRAVERQLIESNLHRALENQEFILHYQPKINLETGLITGAEALLRWVHPEWGTVLPERFLSIAEECGLIVPIDRWVLQEACTQTKRWLDEGLDLKSIAVNISAIEFRQKNFLNGVRDIFNDTGLEISCLQLEITESVLMRDVESSSTILRDLKDIGVQLAVDDFGTGYSSLSYLKQFPIDILKIDQSFVQGIGSASHDGIIVSAVIDMCNNLNLHVVAEGVETQEQLTFLKARYCDEGQGYYFSRPLAADKFSTLLASGVSLSCS